MPHLAAEIRVPVGARHLFGRFAWHLFGWGTNGSFVHALVFAVTCAAIGSTVLLAGRRGSRPGRGTRRGGMTTDASGRLDVDRELEERHRAARRD